MSTETKAWTLEELWRLPDDGDKYELLDGELFVTPAPSELHEDILARIVDPERRQVHIVRPQGDDETADTAILWQPMNAEEPLRIPLAAIFDG